MASGIRNPNVLFEYVSEEWKDGSKWTFRREQTSDDRDKVQSMITKVIMGNIVRKEVRDLLKNGGDLEKYIADRTETKTIMSGEKGMLARMGVKCEGPFFTIPDDFTEETGDISPMAGKLIPQPPPRWLETTNPAQYEADLEAHIKWLGYLDPDERSAALSFMTGIWAGRDPKDVKTFPGSGVGVDEPSRRRGVKG